MLTTLYYFLQVILCSGIMMGYYWVVLRNKRFHQYNRFYLLAIALFAWIVPLIKIEWNSPAADQQLADLFAVIANNNSEIESSLQQGASPFGWQGILMLLYAAGGVVLLVGLTRSFFRIYWLLKSHSCKSVGDVYLVLTHANGAPFSFFRYIFWHESIDLNSEAGKQMMQHELTHVQQKHSADKLVIQLVLIAGWFNPFFWLMKKEMEMIHEFIADHKAVADGDTASLAQMLLAAAYPQQHHLLTNPFFFSPIKRRLQMITNNKTPKFSYMRRLVVLPLLAIVVVLFAFRSKEQRNAQPFSVAGIIENIAAPIKEKLTAAVADTTILGGDSVYVIPKDKQVRIIKEGEEKMVSVFGNGNVMRIQKTGDNNAIFFNSFSKGTAPIIEVNGKRIDEKDWKAIAPNDIASINVLKGNSAELLYGAEGKDGVVQVLLKSAKAAGEKAAVRVILTDTVVVNKTQADNAIIILDGKKLDIKMSELKLSPDEIATVNVLKGGDNAIRLYGDAAKNGVIEITSKYISSEVKELKFNSSEVIVFKRNGQADAGLKSFMAKNPDVKLVYWLQSPLRLTIKFKDGSEESFDMTNTQSIKRAEKKYGQLPTPPPTPPTPPSPPTPAAPVAHRPLF